MSSEQLKEGLQQRFGGAIASERQGFPGPIKRFGKDRRA